MQFFKCISGSSVRSYDLLPVVKIWRTLWLQLLQVKGKWYAVLVICRWISVSTWVFEVSGVQLHWYKALMHYNISQTMLLQNFQKCMLTCAVGLTRPVLAARYKPSQRSSQFHRQKTLLIYRSVVYWKTKAEMAITTLVMYLEIFSFITAFFCLSQNRPTPW